MLPPEVHVYPVDAITLSTDGGILSTIILSESVVGIAPEVALNCIHAVLVATVPAVTPVNVQLNALFAIEYGPYHAVQVL